MLVGGNEKPGMIVSKIDLVPRKTSKLGVKLGPQGTASQGGSSFKDQISSVLTFLTKPCLQFLHDRRYSSVGGATAAVDRTYVRFVRGHENTQEPRHGVRGQRGAAVGGGPFLQFLDRLCFDGVGGLGVARVARECDGGTAQLAVVAVSVHGDRVDIDRGDVGVSAETAFHLGGGDVVAFGAVGVA